MDYLVGWADELKRGYHESGGFAYCEDYSQMFYGVKAIDKENAVELFLEAQYKSIYEAKVKDSYECDIWDESLMRSFIEYARHGDDSFPHARRHREIEKLSHDICDRFLELIMRKEGMEIEIKNGEFSYNVPGTDDCYVDQLCDEFEPKMFLELLCDEEKMEAFILFNKYEVSVIELEDIKHM